MRQIIGGGIGCVVRFIGVIIGVIFIFAGLVSLTGENANQIQSVGGILLGVFVLGASAAAKRVLSGH